MNKAQIKSEVKSLFLSGSTKAEVFAQLSGQGVSDSQLAYLIASHPNPLRCEQHRGKVNIIVTLLLIQAAIIFLYSFQIGATISPNARWIFAAIFTFLQLLFVWGFYTNRVAAYNVYLFLSIIQLAKEFKGFSSNPDQISLLVMGIGIAFIAYIFYVREKIFPGFVFLTPKKVKGEYVFVD